MGATPGKLKRPDQGMMGTFKGKPSELLTEFGKAQSEQGELEGLRSVRKKYNIKAKKIYPREKALLAKEEREDAMGIRKKTLLG